MARYLKEELSSCSDQTLNLILAVEELNVFTSQEISKLLRESENYTIQYKSKTGSFIQVDMERLASTLPLHLLAMLVSSSEDVIASTHLSDNGMPLKYLLHGFRLLHSLSDLTSRHMRFEQIMLDEVRVSEQVLDLVFYMLLVLACYEQDNLLGVSIPLLHSALVASSFHLLTSYISSKWQDLVHVLLAHPKVDLFIDAAFDAIHVNVKFLHIILSALDTDVVNNKSSLVAAEKTANSICQHCEASLQFVVSLCQQKLFRDHVLKNKELCKNGGILSLAQTILDLNVPQSFKESFEIVAAISRLKSKVLSILLQLCEAENISYLDEVAGSLKSMNLAKSVVLKILDLLKAALAKEVKPLADSFDRRKPKGLVLLNSMRLADIISDDSNFRSFFMVNMSCVLAQILAMPHEFFISSWCSTDSPIVEEDAVLDYDPFVASGTVLSSLNVSAQVTLPSLVKHEEASAAYAGNLNRIPQPSYAHQRTSYLVKIIANLHCFVPNVCEEREKDLFLSKFCECLHVDVKPLPNYPSNSDLPRVPTICKNLHSLTIYARSLSPNLLIDDDLELLSLFHKQLLAQIPLESTGSIQDSVNDVGDKYGVDAKDSHVLMQDSLEQAQHPNSKSIPNHQVNVGNSYGDTVCSYSPRHGLAENDDHLFAQDASAQEQVLKQENSIGVNGVSESLLYHESDKLNAMSKPKDLPDGLTKLDENVKNGKFFVSQCASELLKDNGKEVQNSETSGSDMNNVKGNADLIMDSGDFPQMVDSMKETDLLRIGQNDEKQEALPGEEKQPRKRKRNIMNDKQITLIENALLEEPEMQRNAPMLQTWADKLSLHGSELTSSQLKNWLNNRKARLARAAREVRTPSEGDNAFQDRSSISHFYDSPESGGEESCTASTSRRKQSMQTKLPSRRLSLFEPGQSVSVVDAEGMVVGRGRIHQIEGRWHGKSLEESRTCVVSIVELKVERSTCVQHPSEAAGPTFEEAEARNGGVMRVAWDTSMLLPLQE